MYEGGHYNYNDTHKELIKLNIQIFEANYLDDE